MYEPDFTVSVNESSNNSFFILSWKKTGTISLNERKNRKSELKDSPQDCSRNSEPVGLPVLHWSRRHPGCR